MLTTPTKLPLPIPRHGHGFICKLKEGLRAGEFARQWANLGGAVGIASFMREQSIPDLDWLCRRLGKLYKISASKAERQERFSELLILLCPLDPRKPAESPNPDTTPFERDRRPLRKLYGHLVRACTDEVSQQWYPELGWEDRMRQYLPATHPDQVKYRQQQLEKCFSGRCLDLGPVDGIIGKDKRFAMDLLARVADQDPKNFDLEPARFLDSLALPLAKHWWRRGRGHPEHERLWHLLLDCLHKWPQLGKERDVLSLDDMENHPEYSHQYRRRGFMWYFRVFWYTRATQEQHARTEAIFQGLWKAFLKARPDAVKDYNLVDTLENKVRKSDAQNAIGWYFETRYGFNIMSLNEADIVKVQNWAVNGSRPAIPMNIFTYMPKDKAFPFLKLLQKTRPDHPVCLTATGPTATILTIEADYNYSYGDLVLLELHLGGKIPLEEMDKMVNDRMGKAERGLERDERVFWSKSAIFLSVASCSFELLPKTLLWARRFDKDAGTVAQAYEATLAAVETRHLLSCMDSEPARITEDIRAGDKIILALLEAVGAGLRDRTIRSPSWLAVRDFAGALATRRLEGMDCFQDSHGLSGDAIYDLAWQPTIDMLVSVERFALEQEFIQPAPEGFLVLPESINVDKARDHVWRFIDSYAQARDDIWHQARLKKSPAVATLQPPWPKGLPVQYLCPLPFRRNTYHKLPFLASKSKSILFAEPQTLLSPPPESRKTRDAIQGFVEEFRTCLHVHIHAPGKDGTFDCTARKETVRIYTMQRLTCDGLTQEEAVKFWNENLVWMCPHDPTPEETPVTPRPITPLATPRLPCLSFPVTSDPRTPTEWNPDPAWLLEKDMVEEIPPPKSRSPSPIPTPAPRPRTLKPTCLSSLLAWVPGYYSHPFRTEFLPVELKLTPPLVAVEVPHPPPLQPAPSPRIPMSFWGKWEWSLELKVVLALHINSRYGFDKFFLTQPATNTNPVTIPALYLSQEFLDSLGNLGFQSLEYYLERHPLLPTDVLSRLVDSVVTRLLSGQNISHMSADVPVMLILQLSKSLQPRLAVPLIRRFIVDGQEYSTHHRRVFNARYLSSLKASEASEFLDDITDDIIERLEKQEAYKGSAQGHDGPPPPAIKVTVVKMLAEVLQASKFVGTEKACSILLRIIKNASHLDIRTAVVSSLFNMLKASASNEDQVTILAALETHAVPVAAALTERYVMTEEDWERAESPDAKLPTLDRKSSPNTPMLQLVKEITKFQTKVPTWDGTWEALLISQVLALSTRNCKRWCALFLQKSGFSLPEYEPLPALPLTPGLIKEFFEEFPELMPADTFNQLRDFVMVNLAPPPGIAEINRQIKDNTNANQAQLTWDTPQRHWLELYGQDNCPSHFSAQPALYLGGPEAAKLLIRPLSQWKRHRTPNGITVKMIQDFLFEIIDALIMGSNHATMFRLIDIFSTLETANLPNTKSSLADAIESISTNGFPLLKRIISRVDNLRTEVWQQNPRRYPKRLPSTFGMRAKLLPWVLSGGGDGKGGGGDIVARLEGLVGGIKGLVGDLALREIPCQGDLEVLMKEVRVKMEHVEGYRYLELGILVAGDVLPVCVHAGEGDGGGGGKESIGRGEYIRAGMACEFVRIGMRGGEAGGGGGGGDDERRRGAELGVREMLMNWVGGYDEYLREEARGVLGSFGWLGQ